MLGAVALAIPWLAACGDAGAAHPGPAGTEAVALPGPGGAPLPAAVSELAGAFPSVYALGEAILEGIREGDADRLERYRIDEAEWAHIVWPRLPSSRPGRNVSWSFVWRDLSQKSRAALLRTIDAQRGRPLRLLRVEFAGETSEYGTYRVHRDARCVVETASGRIVRLDLFGSVIERHGRFKAFSYVVD